MAKLWKKKQRQVLTLGWGVKVGVSIKKKMQQSAMEIDFTKD